MKPPSVTQIEEGWAAASIDNLEILWGLQSISTDQVWNGSLAVVFVVSISSHHTNLSVSFQPHQSLFLTNSTEEGRKKHSWSGEGVILVLS
jgi:hypothetical protein